MDERDLCLQTLPLDQQGVIDAGIPSAGEPTIYALLGDFVLMALILLWKPDGLFKAG